MLMPENSVPAVNSPPWLSVVVPVYNGERYLVETLQSLLAQCDGSVEILVSDDGSNDASTQIVDSFAGFNCVRRVMGPGRGNWVANTNAAVTLSAGKFVTFLHQDDLWLPGRLRRMQQAISANSDCSLWINPSRFIGPGGDIVGTWRLPFRRAEATIEPDKFVERLLVQNFIGMPAPVFSRRAFEAVGGMDESLWFTADWDLWLKLGRTGNVSISPDATTGFRLHTNSQTMTGNVEEMRTQIEIVRARYIEGLAMRTRRNSIDRAGNFSSTLNTCLARALNGETSRWRELAGATLRLGMNGAYRFARDARFHERLVARLRVGFVARTASK